MKNFVLLLIVAVCSCRMDFTASFRTCCEVQSTGLARLGHNLLFFLLLFPFSLPAQTSSSFWKKIKTRQESSIFQLDQKAFRSALENTPKEAEIGQLTEAPVFYFPSPEGQLIPFRIYETPIFGPKADPSLSLIKTYSGRGEKDAAYHLKMELKGRKIGVFIINEQSSWLIEATSNGRYEVYGKKVKSLKQNCLSSELSVERRLEKRQSRIEGELYIYRLALTASGEYSEFWGGREETLSALVSTVNRLNAIMERDLAIRLQLVDDMRLLIFLDALFDPFELNGNQNVQNQRFLDQNLGTDEYDIGHVLMVDENANGFGSVGSACVEGKKGGGYSILPDPSDDFFIIDFLAHELGHQLGANHTFSHCGTSKAGSLPFEPGSGSTIMAYGGLSLCEGDNFVEHAGDYFHSASIEEIYHFTRMEEGSECPTVINFPNTAPAIQFPEASVVIPQQTPFELSALATDAQGDTLTYCWEQMDSAVQLPLGQIGEGSPLFRSFPPSPSPVRSFPNLKHLISGKSLPSERLPDFSGELSFRLTVRDNHFRGGGISWKEQKLSVSTQAGPFRLITAEEPEVWPTGSDQLIRWEVAGTDLPPVNADFVDVYLMYDSLGRVLVPLARQLPNTGETVIGLPDDLPPGEAWLKVKAHGGVFFALSDSAIEIRRGTTSSSEEVEESLLHIYPNPAKRYIFIESKLGGYFQAEIVLMDVWGRVVWKKQVELGGEGIRLELPGNLTDGVYSLNVLMEEGKYCQRLFIDGKW